MRYMLMRKADANTEQGIMPTSELLEAMGEYNERMFAAGVFVTGDGLRPSSDGFRIRFTDGEPEVIRGPFEQTGELLAGYTVIEVDSPGEALGWAKQWPRSDAAACLEVRRYYEMEDFAPGPALERHARLGKAQQRQPVGLCTHLTFPGSCREAMNFYASVFGASLEINTFGETPMADQVPPEQAQMIAHAELHIGRHVIMGADMAPGCGQQAPGATVQLQYDNLDVATEVFQELADGGTVHMPIEKTFWAQGFGMLTDRFGTSWMFNCGLTPVEQWQ
ncbi:VOC family protein [Halopseudomonas nanhaiensis]|uniref:YciI family protein n=1 Tax=Halopseudomonas nanhaiensis TaxID=2830842 RepID=UPI001CBB9CE0|nr:YciI family protein [Halopseudomonas nanhaiensis]UAW99621.1 VOC family protein [Halopseudomonas nanhaiensis]